MLIQTLWEATALWGERSAVRRQRDQADATRRSEQAAHAAENRYEAERQAMITRLCVVGYDPWWRSAHAATVLAGWYDARTWCRDDPIAEHARRRLMDGLLERHGIDTAEFEQDPAALEQAVRNAYSGRAARDRAQTAQRYAAAVVADAAGLDDAQRRYACAAIAQYAQAAARVLANRRRAIPVEGNDQAIRESARVAIELVLSASTAADRDKVLFALNYLTGDAPADLATADWHACSDTHAKLDAALREYQRRLTYDQDVTGVARDIAELTGALPDTDRHIARTRATRIATTPNSRFPMLWPGAVRKDLLGRQITDYVRASWSHPAGDGQRAAELRGVILAPHSELSPIERDHLILTLADVEQPGLSPLPRTLWADHESQYRDRRKQAYLDTVQRSAALIARIAELFTAHGIDPHAARFESVHGTVAALCKRCQAIAVNGSDPREQAKTPAHRTALADQLNLAGITDPLRADILTAATHLEITATWASTTTGGKAATHDEQPADASAATQGGSWHRRTSPTIETEAEVGD